MNAAEEKRLEKRFEEYVRKFAGKSGKLPPMLKLKLVHSRRVSKDAAGIAEDLGFSRADVRTARMLGLFHDIGRFNQFTRHKTFRDDLSFNHGHHGAEIMLKCGVLKSCRPRDRRRIIIGIRHHNRARLPSGFENDVLQFIKLGRDADKLDIFHVLYDSLKKGVLHKSPDITLRVKLDGPVNPLALEELRLKKTVSVINLKSLADFFLIQLSWVYDINFAPTFRRMISRRIIAHLAEVLPKTPEIKEQIEIAKRHMRMQLAPRKKTAQDSSLLTSRRS